MQEENPVQSQASEMSMRDYVDLLRRRKAIILQTFMVVFVLGVAITFMAKPVYRTTARILVEGKSFNINQLDNTNPLSALFGVESGHDINTQLEVLMGDKVLADAYKDADVPPGSSKLSVSEVNHTDVIELVVESSQPTYAERLAKTLPFTYLTYVTGNRKSELNNALQFATNHLQEENDRLIEAEVKLEHFKSAQHIVDANLDRDRRLTAFQRAEEAMQLARTETINIEALLAKVKDDIANTPDKIKFVDTVPNTAYENLKAAITQLEIDKQKLLFNLKPTNLKVKEVDSQINYLKERQKNTPEYIERVTYGNTVNEKNNLLTKKMELEGQLSAKNATKRDAEQRMHQAEASLDAFGPLERKQSELLRDVDLHKGTVSLLIKSVEELRLRSKMTHDPVLVIAPAAEAYQIAPKKVNNLVYASIIGIMLGLCFALLQEFMDDRINSPEDARRIVGTPALGYVPMIENEDSRLLNGSRGGGSVLESYRVLRSNVRFAAIDTQIRSILVTSTVPGEGKSVTAYNLAVSMALDGRSVILVDTDLRRPTMHEKAKLSQQPGLTNVLVGHTSFEDALKETTIPGMRVLTAGPLPPNPAELLNSQAMRQLLQTLKESADVVIFDSPPCLATADAQVLAAETDGVLYVVQFGEAKKSAVKHAIEMLRQARARVLGVVFNKIDLTAKRDAYYYGYYGYYGYYQTTQLEDGRPRRRRSTAEFEALLPRNQVQQNTPESASPELEDVQNSVRNIALAEGREAPKGNAGTTEPTDDEEIS
jgi:polysaccharide biosynthesis transport protein